MRKLLLAFVFLASVGGCKKKAPEKTELVNKLEALADKGCGCKDTACADGVKKEVKVLADSTSAGKLSSDEMTMLQGAQKKLDECLAPLDARVIAYAAISEEICKCADKACAQAGSDKLVAWAHDVRDSKEPIPTGIHAIFVTGANAAKCLKKFGLEVPQ